MVRRHLNQKSSPENDISKITLDNSVVISLSLSTENGDPLYCQKCKAFKPRRTHHCKECNKCTAKMDQ